MEDADQYRREIMEEVSRVTPKPTRKRRKQKASAKTKNAVRETDINPGENISVDDFHAYMPMHNYIFVPTLETWPAASVNALPPMIGADDKPISPAKWLDENRRVDQMTWAPGQPMLIEDRLVSDGGWIERKGVRCFNLYRAPTTRPGNPNNVGPWLDHVHRVFGCDAHHIIKFLAQRAQHPEVKVNHALVLGGAQGIGKDTLLEPVKSAVGPWNFHEVSPQQLLGRFNSFLKSVVLRISEARDLGEVNRYSFYDHLKAYTAAPPDVLRCDEKHLREHAVMNVTGVIITTNHKSDGIFLPADDRRHFVAWSNLTKDDFNQCYWNDLWHWYRNGGVENVGTYLAQLDISGFDPKAPPPKTPAFWDIVDANRAPEDADLADALDRLGNPGAVTLHDVAMATTDADFAAWLRDRKNRRNIPHRFEKCGYAPIRNDTADDGLWKIRGRRQVVYAKATLSIADQIGAARNLTHG